MSSTTQTADTIVKKPWGESMKAYLDRRAMIMLFLGFAAGIPILLIFSSLGLWLREAGLDRSTVTMFSWAALGYSFKFIWAPLIDALPLPILTKIFGRRRSWMLVSQFGIIAAILTMASVNPVEQSMLIYMAIGAVLLGFSSATQDIVIDAYRIELAPPDMQPILSSTYIAGYRIGMVIAGAGALYLADFFGSTKEVYSYEAWRNTYYIMAGVMGIGIITTLLIHEPIKKALVVDRSTLGYLRLLLVFVLSVVAFIFSYIFSSAFEPTSYGRLGQVMMHFMDVFKLITIACYAVIMIFILKLLKKQISSLSFYNITFSAVLSCLLILIFKSPFSLTELLFTETSPLISFGTEVAHLLTVISFAFITGFSLVRVGLVEDKVAIEVWVDPIFDFFKRYGLKALLLLALIGLYRISDIVAGVISNVFYQDMDFSKTDIATAVKLVGVWVSIAGGLLGGLLSQRMRIMHAMMVGAVLACVSNLLFILLAHHSGEASYLYLAVILDNLAAGLASAVFVAFLSALTSIRFTAVQYAIFSSLMTFFPKVLGGYSGTIVENTSYEYFFGFTFMIGIPILILVWLVNKYIEIGEPMIGDE